MATLDEQKMEIGIVHKTQRKKLEKPRMDFGVRMGTAFWAAPIFLCTLFFIACAPDSMNMEEYFRVLESYVASRKLHLGDGESVLSLLYEAYGDVNRIDDDQIKADFGELYRLLNGMPL